MDMARYLAAQQGEPASVTPTYVVASLPGEKQPEFLLLLPFTPRTKDNLIGLMLARCDGDHLGKSWCCNFPSRSSSSGPRRSPRASTRTRPSRRI